MKYTVNHALAVLYFGVILQSEAKKERVEDQNPALSQLSEQLWHEIEKRLDELDSAELRREHESCAYAEAPSSIIKTDASLKTGAVFVNNPAVASQEECWANCCSNDECDTAIFKTKESEV